MKIEAQCCTLQQAKRLKELGVIQESLFYHWLDYDGYGHKCIRMDKWNNGRQPVCSAFTVAELGVMLQMTGVYTCVNTVLMGWAVHHVNDYSDYELRQPGNINSYNTEAEARAAILIELLEDKKITAEEVNRCRGWEGQQENKS